MGIELVSGRDFLPTDDENAPGVVLINETMARTVWPSEPALGKRIRVFSRRGIRHDVYEVVGIVRDVKVRTLWEEPRTYFYFPLAQRYFQRLNLQVHTSLPPMSVLPGVREVVRGIDDDLPIFDARPLSEERSILLARQRAVGALLGLSALLALVLAGVGIYGVTSHHVARRRPEVGLRMALGADGRDIARWVLGHGMVPALLGVVLGLVAAFEAGEALDSLLIGVAAKDLPTFAVSAFVLITSAAAACAIPAIRATRIDPAAALHAE
jgi:putative ABC transport system permease protein